MPRKKTAVPEPIVREVSAVVKLSYIECHSEGHTWRRQKGRVDAIDAEPGLRPPFNTRAVGRRAICDSCGCERLRWYTHSGEVVNRYRYADGYLHNSKLDDEPAPSRQDWRVTLIKSVFADIDW
jgi:hypothetical protein